MKTAQEGLRAGLLGIEDLSRTEIEWILRRAREIHQQQAPKTKGDALRGRMVVLLFFESSTRTRTRGTTCPRTKRSKA